MERYINIQGAHNIRDLGGYRTLDGGKIKWRKIFRAGLLSKIEASDSKNMEALQLQSICDFRTQSEQTTDPDRWVHIEQLNRFSLPIGEGRVGNQEWLKTVSLEEGENHYLYRANRSYVMRETNRFKEFFKILLEEQNYPLLFHCTAGKDRTGFASYLLLSALGVDWETIRADYLLTNQYMETFAKNASEKIAPTLGLQPDQLKSLFQAKEIYLQGAIDAISQEYETTDHYLKQSLGIGGKDIQQLKRILVDY